MRSLSTFEWVLWAKNLAICFAVVSLVIYLHRGKNTRGGVVEFALASVFFLAMASSFLWFMPDTPKWTLYLLRAENWTVLGDVVVLLLSLGYGYAIVTVVRLLAHGRQA
jgi:hypothetical protein